MLYKIKSEKTRDYTLSNFINFPKRFVALNPVSYITEIGKLKTMQTN